MKLKFILGLFMIVFFLYGCTEDTIEQTPTPPIETVIIEEVFDYTYEMHISNYESLLDVETKTLDKTSDHQRFEFKVNLINTLDFADNVTFDFKIMTKSMLFQDEEYEYTFQTTYNGREQHIYIATYPELRTLYDFKITKVTGRVKSHTDYDIVDPYQESLRLYQELNKDISNAFSDDLTKLTFSQVIELSSPYQYQRNVIRTIVDLEEFYFSVITDNVLGTILLEKNNQYWLYQYFTFDNDPYVQLVGVYDELTDVNDDIETTPEFEFKDTWFYTYQNNVYTIKATLGDLMRVIIDDEESIKNLVGIHENLEVVMEITVSSTTMTFNLSYAVNQTEVRVRNYYSFNEAQGMNFEQVNHVPMNSPFFITEFTDLTSTLDAQLYINGYPNYYVISLEEGLYALEHTSDFIVEFYDEDLNLVPLALDKHYDFQTRINNVYHFEEGIYIVKVYYKYVRTLLYSLELIPISENYETIVNVDEPIMIEGEQLEINIEGIYDYVIAKYANVDKGLLFLESDTPFKGNIYILQSDGILAKARIQSIANGYIIYLSEGDNILVFDNPTMSESITFNIEAYGTRFESGQTLPDTFPDAFVVSRPFEDIYYNFELDEPSMVTFEAILDPIFGNNVSRNYQIWSTSNNSTFDLSLSFSMTTSKEVYLPEGKYAIRVMNLVSIKLKGTFVPHTPITNISTDILELNNMKAFDQDPFAFLQTYQQYPLTTLTFEIILTEKTYLLVAYTSTRNYTLLDQEGNRVNFTHPSSHQLFVLSSGSYYLSIPKNQNFFMSEVKIGFYKVTDESVFEDDNVYDYQNAEKITLDTIYHFEKEYLADHEFVSFTLDEKQWLTISLNVQMFAVLYNSQRNYMTATYSSVNIELDAGTYYLLLIYMSSASAGYKVRLSINTVT